MRAAIAGNCKHSFQSACFLENLRTATTNTEKNKNATSTMPQFKNTLLYPNLVTFTKG